MGERVVDRAAWAKIVETLLDEECAGNKTAFASAVGVDRKTVSRWLAQDVDVSEESVRDVARAFKLSAMDLLIQVGYYTSEEFASRVDEEDDRDGDQVAHLIKTAKVPPSVKRELRQYVAERREAFEAQLAADVQRLIASETRGRRSA